MATIVELKAHGLPPKGEDWAMVVVHRQGIGGESVIRHARGATFFTPAAEAEVARAINKATTWADTHSVGVVYLRRDG